MSGRHIGLMLLISAVWAFNIIAIKETVTHIPPLATVALRYVALLAICLPFMRRVPGRMGPLVAASLVAGALHFGLGGISFWTATNLSALAIAGQLGVPFSLVLAILFLGERIQWRRQLGLLLSFLGVALLLFDPRIVDERLALGFMTAAAFTWAAGNLLLRRLQGVHVLNILGWQALIGIPCLALASALIEPGQWQAISAAPPSAWGFLAFSVLGATLIGHAGMAWMLQRYPVSVIAPLTLPSPVLGVAFATLWYGTPITPIMALGGLISLTGVAIITLRTARIPATVATP